MRHLVLALVLAPLFAPLHAQYFAQIGNGTAGNTMIQTEFICVNPGPWMTQVTIEFFASGRDEKPLDLPIEKQGTINTVVFSLGKGESYHFRTTGSGPLVAGYARVNGGVQTSVVFTGTNVSTGQVLFEAGVPPSVSMDDSTLYVDTRGSRDVGVAVLNTSDAPASVRMKLYDSTFDLLGVLDRTFYVREHVAQFVSEMFKSIVPGVSEMTGVLTLDTDRPLAILPLRQNASTLTTLPGITGRSDARSVVFFDDFNLNLGTIPAPPWPWIDVSSTSQKASGMRDVDKRSMAKFYATEPGSQRFAIGWECRYVNTSTDWNLEFLGRDLTGNDKGTWSVGLGRGIYTAPEGDWVELCVNGSSSSSLDYGLRKQGDPGITASKLTNRDSGYHRFQILSDKKDIIFVVDLVEVGRIKDAAFAPSRIVIGVTKPTAELQIDWMRFEIN